MTLCQYYDQYAKKAGYKCWNTFCAATPEHSKEWLKKQLKKQYKEMKKNESR